MADLFPAGSTPGQYATYPGRVVLGSIPDRVAPDLESSYYQLAPDPDVFYGTFFPAAFNRPGSARWMQEGTNFRWTLPSIVREGLLGALDLANATQTGELTPRAAQTFMSGLPAAGIALAERGSLGAAGAPFARFYADPEAAAKAQALGFRTDLSLYHSTYGPDFQEFGVASPRDVLQSLLVPGRRVLAPGMSAAEDPRYASNFGMPLPRSPEGWLIPTSRSPELPPGPARTYPLVARYRTPTDLLLKPGDRTFDIYDQIMGHFQDGYDAVRMLNDTSFPELGPQTTWVFREPNQLRSPFAAFDPTRRDSADLLAGSAAPMPLATPGFRPQSAQPDAVPSDGYPRPYHRPQPPQRTGPPSLAESLAYWRLMNEPKVY